MESEQEIPRGIQLISAGEKLTGYKDDADPHFESKGLLIPSIGTMRLIISRQLDYLPEDISIALTESGVTEQTAQTSFDKGLFDVWLKTEDSIPNMNSDLECIMHIPGGPTLKSTFNFSSSDEPGDGTAGVGWKKLDEEGDNQYYFFAPANPKLLSQLRFSFQSTEHTKLAD